jgi:hypothetical protein
MVRRRESRAQEGDGPNRGCVLMASLSWKWGATGRKAGSYGGTGQGADHGAARGVGAGEISVQRTAS